MDLPEFVQIEPVGQCNLRCRMCPIQFRTDGRKGGPPAMMAYEDFCNLIDQFPRITHLHLQGLGEPLIHPRYFDMVHFAAQRRIQVSTNTNLTILSEARANECVTSGLHTVHISLDGATERTFESIRIRARFEKVLRNLRRLMHAKAQAGSTLPHVRMVCVVMRANLSELPALVTLAHAEGVEALSVQHLCHDFGETSLPEKYRPMRSFIDTETLLHEDPELVERIFQEARKQAQALGLELRLPNVRPKMHDSNVSGRSRCDWPWRGAYISYDGSAMPCCMVATPDRINFGNVLEQGVATVWNSDDYNAFRSKLDSSEPSEICRSCAVYTGTF